MQLYLFIFAAAAIIALSFAKEQKVRIRGQVICDKRTVRNVQVELREHDTLDPDDSLATTHTDYEGNFRLSGTESELTSIKPYVRITHKCDVVDHVKCHRQSDYTVPEKAINYGGGVFDMQWINLNIKGNNDKKICD